MSDLPTTTMTPRVVPAASTEKKRRQQRIRGLRQMIFFLELLLFPFCCLDAKGLEEFIYISLCHLSLYLELACKTLTYVWVGHVDMTCF
jgi:hypothetical protein